MSSIHQEVKFPAAVAHLPGARRRADSRITGAPASGEGAEGAAFSIFGGHIIGRHVELMPGKRVVQRGA